MSKCIKMLLASTECTNTFHLSRILYNENKIVFQDEKFFHNGNIYYIDSNTKCSCIYYMIKTCTECTLVALYIHKDVLSDITRKESFR